MRSPKKTAWRKQQKGKLKGIATRGNSLEHGSCGLKAMSLARIKARQLEAGRVVINRTLKRAGNLIIRPFPDLPVTKKPAEVRMGSGKGAVDYWAARVYPGTMLFEVDGSNQELLKDALRKAGCRMPCRWKVVTKEQQLGLYASNAHIHSLSEKDTYIQG